MNTVGEWLGFLVRLGGGIAFARWIYLEVKHESTDARLWALGAFLNWPIASYAVAVRYGNFWYFWFGLAGLLVMPFGVLTFSLPYSVAWYVLVFVAAIVGPIARKVALDSQERHREHEAQQQLSELLDLAERCLDSLSEESEEERMSEYKEANRKSNANRILPCYTPEPGTRAEVLAKVRHKVEYAWRNRDSGKDELRQASAIGQMLRDGRSSCLYDWGINRVGFELRRFGADRFAYVEIFVSGER